MAEEPGLQTPKGFWGPAAEVPAADEAAAEEPVQDEKQTAVGEPAAEETASEEHVAMKVEESAVEDLTQEEEEPVTREPMQEEKGPPVEEPMQEEKPASEDPVPEEHTATGAREPSAEEPRQEEKELAVEEPVAEESSSEAVMQEKEPAVEPGYLPPLTKAESLTSGLAIGSLATAAVTGMLLQGGIIGTTSGDTRLPAGARHASLVDTDDESRSCIARSQKDNTRRVGTMRTGSLKFGFITQDCHDGDVFVLPSSCPVFGRMLPPSGTRVAYWVSSDPMTGKLRAKDVRPLDSGHAAGKRGLRGSGTTVNEDRPATVAARAGWRPGLRPCPCGCGARCCGARVPAGSPRFLLDGRLGVNDCLGFQPLTTGGRGP